MELSKSRTIGFRWGQRASDRLARWGSTLIIALAIAGKLGFRLIKRDSVCFSCHYTPIVERGQIRVDSGVSCESCHGAGRDWIDVHNDYGGKGFDHASETAEHRAERVARSRELGMRRPSDLYPAAASCFGCHTVPEERLVNVGGHPAGSATSSTLPTRARHPALASRASRLA